mgnify:CR=1 FL=1
MGVAVQAQTGERIFTYDAAGNVVPNAKFISERVLWNDGVITVHVADVTVQSADKAYKYDLRLSQMEAVGNPTYFDVIDIRCGGKSIYHIKSQEAWNGSYVLDNGTRLGYVTVRHLDRHVTALVFLGWNYDSTPSWITIVILNKDKATIVFNKRGEVTECRTDLPYGLNLTYVDEIQELDNDGNRWPPDSELKKFRIWQEGQYLRFAQTQ